MGRWVGGVRCTAVETKQSKRLLIEVDRNSVTEKAKK